MKKNVKRFMSIIMVMVFVMAAGCGKKEEAAAEKEEPKTAVEESAEGEEEPTESEETVDDSEGKGSLSDMTKQKVSESDKEARKQDLYNIIENDIREKYMKVNQMDDFQWPQDEAFWLAFTNSMLELETMLIDGESEPVDIESCITDLTQENKDIMYILVDSIQKFQQKYELTSLDFSFVTFEWQKNLMENTFK